MSVVPYCALFIHRAKLESLTLGVEPRRGNKEIGTDEIQNGVLQAIDRSGLGWTGWYVYFEISCETSL